MSVQIKGVGTIGGIDQGLNTVGVITATAFHGDGSNLTGLAADKIIEGDTKVEVVDAGSQYIVGEVNGSEKVRITSAGTAQFKGNIEVDTGSAGMIDFGDITSAYGRLYADSTGTFIGSKSNHDLILRTNNQEKLRITSDGNAEFFNGSNSSTIKLKRHASTTSEQAHIGYFSSGLHIETRESTYISLKTNTQERLRITSDGKVGINQTPTRELSIHSPNNNNSLIHFTNDDTGETAADGILIGLNGNEDCIVNNQENGKNIIFYTHNGSSVGERLRMNKDGHIRIGSSGSPSESNWSHSSYGNTEVAIDGGGGYGVLHIRGDGSGSTATKFSMGVGDDKFYMCYDNTDTRHNITVIGNGDVGINRTDPAYKLDVNGTGRYTGDLLVNYATLTVIPPNNSGAATIGQFGQTSEGRYARFVGINNQHNFDHLLLRRYDNSTVDILRLQNTYASGTGWGSGIGWYGHGGNVTGRIKVVNATTNSSVARMHLEVNAVSLIHMDHAPNRVMIGEPTSAGSYLASHIALQCRPSTGNTGCFVGRSKSYDTDFGLLPWSGGGTYISSGTTYNNGNWTHQSSDSTNCLFYMRGNGWYWYSSNNSSASWNVFSGGQVMNNVGQWTGGTSSDRRLKENITNMNSSDALTKVTQLQGVSYTWKNEVQKKYGTGAYPEGTHHGFIAQDVKIVWPDAHIISDTDNESDFDEDPTKNVKDDVYYGDIEGVKEEKMIPLLVEAIKELKKENDALKMRVTTLEGS